MEPWKVWGWLVWFGIGFVLFGAFIRAGHATGTDPSFWLVVISVLTFGAPAYYWGIKPHVLAAGQPE